MEYSNIRIYLWQVAPMPNDPLYSKLKVEHDLQIAIDQSDTSEFIQLLENSKSTSFICTVLPSGQPHSCDNPKEIWGLSTSNFARLDIEIVDQERRYGSVEKLGDVVSLSLTPSQLQDLILTMKGAISAPVFFEYEHYLLLEDKNDNMIKLNFWGWCQNGQIEYAN